MDKGPYASLPPRESCAPGMLVAIWVLFGICALVVGLRVLTATLVLRKMLLADFLMLAALTLTLVSTICTTISAHYGLGQHIMYLDRQQISTAMEWQIISSVIAILSPTLGRISFAVYMFQFIGTSRSKKWILHSCIWSSLVVNILACIFIFAQCNNVQKVWDFEAPGRCWDLKVQAYFGYFQGAVNTMVDLTLTVLPVSVVWILKVPKATKFGLMVLLGLSMFAAVASIYKTVKLHSFNADVTYTFCQFQPWFRVENAVVIIGASIPPCRALLTGRNRREKSKASYARDEELARNKGSAAARLNHSKSLEDELTLTDPILIDESLVEEKKGSVTASLIEEGSRDQEAKE